MPRPFSFALFEENEATVQTPTQSTDDLMGVADTFATKTAVGTSGVIFGSLQALGGQRQEDLQGRFASVVDYVYYVAAGTINPTGISNGDRLLINSILYDILHSEDESGAGFPVVYLHKVN